MDSSSGSEEISVHVIEHPVPRLAKPVVIGRYRLAHDYLALYDEVPVVLCSRNSWHFLFALAYKLVTEFGLDLEPREWWKPDRVKTKYGWVEGNEGKLVGSVEDRLVGWYLTLEERTSNSFKNEAMLRDLLQNRGYRRLKRTTDLV